MGITRIVRVLVAGAVLAAAPAQAQHHRHGDTAVPSGHGDSFTDAERWSKVFDDPARDKWQMPDDVIRALALKASDVVVDIGAGTGYFAVRIARKVPHGRVLAADVSRDMVAYLAKRAKAEGLANMRAVEAGASSLDLPENVDLALLVDTFHHIGNRTDYFGRLRGALKPGGRVAIIDFRPDAPVGAPKHMRLSVAQIDAEMTAAGYRQAGSFDFLPYQHFLLFEIAGRSPFAVPAAGYA